VPRVRIEQAGPPGHCQHCGSAAILRTVIAGRPMLAKIAVKEMTDAATANRIYSVESVEFNEESPAAQWVGEIADADGIDPRTIRSAGEVASLARRVQTFHPATACTRIDRNTSEPRVAYHAIQRALGGIGKLKGVAESGVTFFAESKNHAARWASIQTGQEDGSVSPGRQRSCPNVCASAMPTTPTVDRSAGPRRIGSPGKAPPARSPGAPVPPPR
jgi:hypothetical protein